MSRIDSILAELCPNGVPFRTLGETGEFIRGGGLQKSDLTDAGSPAIHYGQVHTHYGTWAIDTKSFVSEALAARLRRARPGDLVIATTSEDDDAVAKATAWVGDVEVAVSGDAYIYRHSLEPKYVAYFFQSEQFQDQKKRHITGTKVRRLSGASLAKIRIPVPPAEVQREIVGVLDAFASLEAELEAELQTELDARLRQYAYYRDSLLAFPERVRWATLSDLATFKYGYTASAAPVGDYRFIRITDIAANGKLRPEDAKYVHASGEASEYLVRKGDLLMARTGATYGKTMLIDKDADAVYASFLIRIRFNGATVLPGYYWHFAQSGHYWGQANALVSTGGQPQFNANVLKTIKMPVPSLDEQERIVAVLDKFDALVNGLAISLPAELKARRQQYEYYRNKLLMFTEKVA